MRDPEDESAEEVDCEPCSACRETLHYEHGHQDGEHYVVDRCCTWCGRETRTDADGDDEVLNEGRWKQQRHNHFSLEM